MVPLQLIFVCILRTENYLICAMTTRAHGEYTGPAQVLSFDGLLFDFDGTIIDSTAGM